MMKMVKKNWIGILVFSSLATVTLTTCGLVIWGTALNIKIKERLAQKRWAAPTEFYAAPERFLKGQSQASKTLESTLERLDYRIVLIDRPLRPGEFSRQTGENCRQKIQSLGSETATCWIIKPQARIDIPVTGERPLQIAAIDANDVIVEVYEGEPSQPAAVIELEPELFAQFYGGQPVLRQVVNLGDVPPYLLNAIMAIEDSGFLSHHGVSFTGMVRAFLRNLAHGRVAEGGSTITQQLIKNYFLTSERTIRRKVTEILMALLLESQFTKDDILETYINEVYLGQEGPFEVHGVGVASKYFFNKHPSDLTLAESALIAGMIQAPNFYSPAKRPEKTLSRRNLVLKRMSELGLITPQEYQAAVQTALPQVASRLLHDQAPFFIDSVKFQLKKLKIPELEGLQVFTTLNMRAQRAATDAVASGLNQTETHYASIQKFEKKYGAKLQSVLIAANPTNGFVEAVVGGRSYGETQLNRALQSHRQVGSIFKPFVFLTAFSSTDPSGAPYTPLTQVNDEPFTISYDKQSWSPQNFDNKYEGNVPLYRALEESLNAATSKVALQVGIKKIAEVAQKAGIDTPLYPVPSLALGAATLTPFEVLQAYSTLDYKGELNPLTFIYRVTNTHHDLLYEFHPAHIQALDPIEARQTVSLMQNVLVDGTGRSVRTLGFTHPAAGKTGTTSDTKDAWFAGFTPLHSAVVWVGFDQPEPSGLTGALGAIPIWTQYMKTYASRYPPLEFTVPDGAVQVTVDPASGMVARDSCPQKVTLVFKKGTEPTSPCWLSH